jgi:hypothetical protein
MVIHTVFAQKVGETAPDFTLKTLNDQNYTLSENTGDVIFVFLVGYNCPLCIATAPTVKSKILDVFSSNDDFQSLIIDVWDGSASQVTNFKNTTNLNGTYLKVGSNVATSWGSSFNRIAVLDVDGKMIFKGSRDPATDATDAASFIQNALNNITTAINDISEGNKFSVEQNYPNPVLNNTKIKFSISEAANITLSISDISGRIVSIPVNQYFPYGNHEVEINMRDVPRGIYFYILEVGNFIAIKKMVVQ